MINITDDLDVVFAIQNIPQLLKQHTTVVCCGIFYVAKININVISDIDHNNYDTLITTLQCVTNLLKTDIMTFFSPMTAKNAKYDSKMF